MTNERSLGGSDVPVGAPDPDDSKGRNIRNAVALSNGETILRHGSANAEFIKAYSGVDNEVGKTLSKGLSSISKEGTSLQHKAGWAAEVATTARDNADAIIARSGVRSIRSDDLKHYGLESDSKYREAVDRVRVDDGKIVYEAQTKFEKSGNKVANQVSHEDHKYSKYFGKKLELPSEQVAEAKQYCLNRARKLRERALKLDHLNNAERASKFRERADRFERLAEHDIVDVGISRDQAFAYAEAPFSEVAKDIARTSHRAGVEGAKYGAVIAASISLLTNAFAMAQGRKDLEDGACDVLLDAGKGAVVGYATAASGAALKGVMQQSQSDALRALSKTSAPALALTICLSLSLSIHRYANSEISGAELLEEVGTQGAGMLSSAMFSALGQIAVPVPFVGAAIGSMIGFTLSSMFYQAAVGAAKDARASRDRLSTVREMEVAAREEIKKQSAALDDFMRTEFPELQRETSQLFSAIESNGIDDTDAFAVAINAYAELLGAQLQFKSQVEFDAFMASDDSFRL